MSLVAVNGKVSIMVDARAVFDPTHVVPMRQIRARWAPGEVYRLIREFYRSPAAWATLGVFTIVLVYGGGGMMFWYHSIYLGEGGPAISPGLHWFIDSSAGLIALTPALAVILPVATQRLSMRSRSDLLATIYFAATGGALFALATVPGPVLHDNFVGRGTWLADHITRLYGDGRPLSSAHQLEAPVSMSLQFAFGLPVYVALMWLTLVGLRAAVAGWRKVVRN